ncbi:MAG: hypothetical protein LBK03_05785 [Bacteroidales bacterium]|nr:hypothetical protein [Bacteroidales bacterium]
MSKEVAILINTTYIIVEIPIMFLVILKEKDALKPVFLVPDNAKYQHCNAVKNKAEDKEYQRQLTEYATTKGNADRECPQEPPLRMLIIPANNSTTGLFSNSE